MTMKEHVDQEEENWWADVPSPPTNPFIQLEDTPSEQFANPSLMGKMRPYAGKPFHDLEAIRTQEAPFEARDGGIFILEPGK